MFDVDEVERSGAFEAASPRFDLAQLAPPRLTPEARGDQSSCALQGVVFRADLVRAGILSTGDGGVVGAVDAGSDAAEVDPGASTEKGAQRADASLDATPPPPARHATGGCSTQPVQSSPRAAWLALAVVAALRLRARPRTA
jgi:MYXO-CTERM domain-containing protein